MSAESLLLVEDDRGVREALGRALELEGFDVSTAADGLVALEMIVVRSPDAIILDVMMPRLDGLEVARRVRARGDTTPILMLTARHEVSSRVEGLDAGADDYLVKPFALDELLARIRALLRRGGLSGQGERLRMADLSLDPAARRVFRGNREIEFTKTEFDLLELLLFNARIVLPRDMIMDRIWGFDFVTSSNPLEVYIGYLRRKLEAAGETRLIHTVRVRGLRGEGTLSLRRRWALGLGVVAALAIGLTTLAAIVSAERQLRGAVDADLHERAAEVNRRAETLLTEGRNLPRRLPPRIVDFDAVVQAFDTTGAAVLRIGQEGAIPPVEAADLAILAGDSRSSIRDVRIGGVPYRMITIRVQRPAGDRPALLAFQIATDLSRVDANLRALSRRLVTIGLIGVLLVGFTGWVLASRAVRPISDLTDAAEQIASKERLDAGGQLDIAAPGAISRLAGAFSSMLASLSASRREQQRLVSDASHEFRTPITALKTNLEILRRQGDGLSVEQRRELIDAALAESDQPADLATELVDLASDVHHTDGRSWR